MPRIPRKRRVAALDDSGRALVLTQDVPPLKAGRVLVRVRAALISPGTELRNVKRIRGGEKIPGQPRPFGYQNAGEVIAVGKGVRQFEVGDRVACIGGGYAQITDYAVVPQNLCCRLPAKVGFEPGAYGMMALTSLHAIRRGRPELGEYLLVVGLGLIGQFAARLGQLAGMYVMGWDTMAGRNRIAKKWGIDATVTVGRQDEATAARTFTHGHGFDLGILAFGGEGTSALEAARDVMKLTPDGHREGRIVMVGGVTTTNPWAAGLGNLDLISAARTGPGYHDEDWEHGREGYPSVFMRWTTRSNFELVLRMMADGRLNPKALTTHRLPLDRVAQAVDLHLEQPQSTMGTIILPQKR